MKIHETPLSGLLIIEPQKFTDTRGYFFEGYQAKRYQQYHIPAFVQDNFSLSKQQVVRGLHYQLPPFAQGKLVSVIHGKAWDVAVDIRQSSPTFKQWFSITLSDENHQQLYIPPGFAHGFCALSADTIFHYKCTTLYAPQYDRGIRWDDANLNIPWPINNPIVSSKDANLPLFTEISHEHFFD